MPWTAWARLGRVAAVLAVASAVLFASVGTAHPPERVAATEVVLQPCFSGEDCVSDPVTTSDGRILIQVIPLYEGEVQVYVLGQGAPQKAFTCRSPSLMVPCGQIVETGKAGTYRVLVVFGPSTTGALFLEVVTPS